ncbi:MAG: hypothetical protein H6976_11275 [Gammaproteobacteria bacterium]|nr:hypothetical protein [Gammaproteobacteria bacterium]
MTTTGVLAAGKPSAICPMCGYSIRVATNLAIWHEGVHPEPWIIAMNDRQIGRPCGITRVAGALS